MTSMVDDSVSSILCTSKQTRFDIAAPNYREVTSPSPILSYQRLLPYPPKLT